MEALNRLADNSDNWQPRKTRYEPCLSVPPTRITRPLLLASPTAFSTPNERTNEHLLFVRAKRFLRHLKLAGRGLPSMMVQSWMEEKKGKKKKRKKRKKVFRTVSKKEKLLLIFRKRDESFVVVCRIVVDSILINR